MFYNNLIKYIAYLLILRQKESITILILLLKQYYINNFNIKYTNISNIKNFLKELYFLINNIFLENNILL